MRYKVTLPVSVEYDEALGVTEIQNSVEVDGRPLVVEGVLFFEKDFYVDDRYVWVTVAAFREWKSFTLIKEDNINLGENQ